MPSLRAQGQFYLYICYRMMLRGRLTMIPSVRHDSSYVLCKRTESVREAGFYCVSLTGTNPDEIVTGKMSV
jgi:hypothetical protein